MSGFPIRPSRSTFGPRPKNRMVVEDEEEEFGADLADLVFFQTAGIGVVCPIAFCIVTGAGALTSAGEAWDPDGAGDPPVVTKSATGTYVVEYPALVPDRNGVDQPLVLLACKATAQSTSNLAAFGKVRADGRTVDVLIRNAAGTLLDADFLLEVR